MGSTTPITTTATAPLTKGCLKKFLAQNIALVWYIRGVQLALHHPNPFPTEKGFYLPNTSLETLGWLRGYMARKLKGDSLSR